MSTTYLTVFGDCYRHIYSKVVKTFDQVTVAGLLPRSSELDYQDSRSAQHGGRLGAVRNQGSLWEFWRASANSIAAVYSYVGIIWRFNDVHNV